MGYFYMLCISAVLENVNVWYVRVLKYYIVKCYEEAFIILILLYLLDVLIESFVVYFAKIRVNYDQAYYIMKIFNAD